MIRFLLDASPFQPKESVLEYRRYRARLFFAVGLWAALLAVGIAFWKDIDLLGRAALIAIAILFAPDTFLLQQLFSSYERYRKKGLW